MARPPLAPPAPEIPGHQSPLELRKEGNALILDMPPAVNRRYARRSILVLTALVAAAYLFDAPGGFLAALAGFCAILALLIGRAASRRQQLRLDRDGSGVLYLFAYGRRTAIPLRAGEIHARVDLRESQARGADRTDVSVLVLDHGGETHELLLERGAAERAWAAEEINLWLGHDRRPQG